MGDARGIGGGCCSMDGRELRGVDNGVRLKELAWGKAGCGGEFSREPMLFITLAEQRRHYSCIAVIVVIS